MPKQTLYQKVYHMVARNRGGPEGRSKALKTLQKQNSPLAKTYAQVLDNNPHFLVKKGTDNYNRLRNQTYQKRLRSKSKGKETRLLSRD